RALPGCLPNPPVGCVLVRHGEVIATGFTQIPGADHAEAMALRKVHGDLSDVTAYVTLEPCSLHGRTPSCAQGLIRRGGAEVVVAAIDPDTRISGRRIEALRVAGLRVTLGILVAEALSDLEPYLALPGNVA